MSLPVYDLRTHRLNASPAEEGGALIDSPAGPHDGLWARDLWPEMRFDRPLGVGADGGHGPVLCAVEAYEPGRRVRFRFAAPRGSDLHHLLATRLRFPARLTYPLLWLPLHDALIEDSLDRAVRTLTRAVQSPARWSPYVRLLRAILIRTARRKGIPNPAPRLREGP
jgi:hypothetical protein